MNLNGGSPRVYITTRYQSDGTRAYTHRRSQPTTASSPRQRSEGLDRGRMSHALRSWSRSTSPAVHARAGQGGGGGGGRGRCGAGAGAAGSDCRQQCKRVSAPPNLPDVTSHAGAHQQESLVALDSTD